MMRVEYDSSSIATTQIEEGSTGEDSFIGGIDDSVASNHSMSMATATRSSALVKAMRSQASPIVPS